MRKDAPGYSFGLPEQVPAHPCWHCGKPNDGVTGINGARNPKPGAVSICAYCLRPAMFTTALGQLATREPTQEELMELYADEQVGPLLTALDAARVRRG